MPLFFKKGERVILNFGVGAPQLAEIITVSVDCKTMTVRLSEGVMGHGDMPLQWVRDRDYDLLAGGTVKIQKLT